MIISYLAIPLMLLSSLPQILKLIKHKDSTGVSMSMFILTFLSVTLLLIEAIRIKNVILITSDSASLTMMAINIYLINKYKK
tara:strand:- start:716 stop:961 length:246 start_codon:yes stop_codon:yes gene_type:complete